jgi:hypothetical protein
VSNVVLVLGILVVVSFVVSVVHRRRRGLVAERGMSIGADLGALGDQPRVHVRAVTREAQDRVRLVLTPEVDSEGSAFDLEFVVELRVEDFGNGLLQAWSRSGSPLAIVIPRGSRLIRLRSIDDLQPLTLRRLDL